MYNKSKTELFGRFKNIFGFKPRFSIGTLDVLWLDDEMVKHHGYESNSGKSLGDFITEKFGEEALQVCRALLK